MKEFNNWIPAQLPLGWGEPVMLALASVAAPALEEYQEADLPF